MQKNHHDIIVVGSGIVGLAAAFAAVKRGLRVAVVERHTHCVGASIRNFGFVTISGQRRGAHWKRAQRSRDIWAEIAPQAGIEVIHSGLYMPTQSSESHAVAEAFLDTEMGEQCRWLDSGEIARKLPFIGEHHGVLFSPHELRVESKFAIKQLATWLEQAHHVTFYRQTDVTAINLPHVITSRGMLTAERVIVCPGNDFTSLYPETIAKANAQQCTLQMLRVMPKQAITLPGAIMTDLSFARYDGFADLPEGQVLAKKLDITQAEYRQQGIHLIAVQSADGSLVIGDSHVYGDAEQPFRNERIDQLILNELQRLMPQQIFDVVERWLGVYASADDVVFADMPEQGVVIGMVTGGTGASTGFAFGEELLAKVLNE